MRVLQYLSAEPPSKSQYTMDRKRRRVVGLGLVPPTIASPAHPPAPSVHDVTPAETADHMAGIDWTAWDDDAASQQAPHPGSKLQGQVRPRFLLFSLCRGAMPPCVCKHLMFQHVRPGSWAGSNSPPNVKAPNENTVIRPSRLDASLHRFLSGSAGGCPSPRDHTGAIIRGVTDGGGEPARA